MARTILIKTGNIILEAVMNSSTTADTIWNELPLAANVNTWGDEIYFTIPVNLELEQGQDVVELGDLGYWPTGHAFCIFFGPTPMSRGEEIRPASAVNVFGKVSGDTTSLKTVSPGMEITIVRKT